MTQVADANVASESAQDTSVSRLKKVSSILITQAPPADNKSPFQTIVDKYKVKVDFRAFLEVKVVPLKEFRKQKINFLEHTAVIFTSRHAVDNYFNMCIEMKVEMPPEMKYYCINEQTANYLQKYIQIRKRKIFSGNKTIEDLKEILKKHKGEKFIYPCSTVRTDDLPGFLTKEGFTFVEAILFQTVPADLSDLRDVFYDVIAFFSPTSVESLFANFPDFKQNNTRLAAFGAATAKSIKDLGLFLDIEAPRPDAPSMAGAIEKYIELTKTSKQK